MRAGVRVSFCSLIDPKFLHSLHHSPYSFPHNSDNPSSQAAKLSDTNVIAITDAKINPARSIKVEVFSVDSKNSHKMQ